MTNSINADSPSISKLKLAVDKTPDIRGQFKVGLGALMSKDKAKGYIEAIDTKKIQGSVYLDKTTEPLYPNCKRWDYVIEYQGNIYYYEPHPAANNDDVDDIIGKAKWLFWWLKNKAPKIKCLGSKGYYWVHTGRFNISRRSRQYRNLKCFGVTPTSRLILK
jgi:hypothetical protein